MSEHSAEPGTEAARGSSRRPGRHRAPQHRAEADVTTGGVVTPLRGRHRGPQASTDAAAPPVVGRHSAPYVYDEPAPVIALTKARHHEAYRQAE